MTATTAAVLEVTVHRLADERTVRVLRRGRREELPARTSRAMT